MGDWDGVAVTYEVEAKLRLPGEHALGRVRERLAAAGARDLGLEAQEDTFFAHPQRDFAATDEALRLRQAGGRLELTYKGPRLAGDGKARVEETVVLDKDPTVLLAALGFRPAARLAKQRHAFQLGAVHVALDHLEGLGDFCEVEVMAEDVAQATQHVDAVVAQLGLAGVPKVRESYLELALRAAAGPGR